MLTNDRLTRHYTLSLIKDSIQTSEVTIIMIKFCHSEFYDKTHW